MNLTLVYSPCLSQLNKISTKQIFKTIPPIKKILKINMKFLVLQQNIEIKIDAESQSTDVKMQGGVGSSVGASTRNHHSCHN